MNIMNRSILEYAATDAFIYLFLTGGLEQTDLNRTTVKSIFHKDFDPEIVEMYGNVLGVPTTISCKNFKMNVDDDGELHSNGSTPVIHGNPSFECSTMTLTWKQQERTLNSVMDTTFLERADGPALITFEGFSVHHHHGRRTRFEFDSMIANWYKRDRMYRAAGPCSLTVLDVAAQIDPSGVIRMYKKPTISMIWNHPADGSNITTDRAQKLIAEDKIHWNQMSPLASAFANPMEEAIFYSRV